ncbi:unnamed protein product [Mucor hiemalis]
MFIKITAIVGFLAIFQLVEVVYGSNLCEFGFNNPSDPCVFSKKNLTECAEVKELLKASLHCKSDVGNGCSTVLEGCDEERIKLHKARFCQDFKGYLKTSDDKISGACFSK